MKAFQIVFEHRDFIAVNKAADLSFHNEGLSLGLASLVSQELSAKLWPVHRLDKITSGLLLFAKTQQAAAKLSALFYDHQIRKIYLALSDRKPKKKQGLIKGDMQKTRNGSWKLCNTTANPAVTRFQSCSLIPGTRFFWIEPQSGKTHQIRVALKSIGAPILGDRRYQGNEADRGYLHAYRLQFIWSNEIIEISCMPQIGELFQLSEIQLCLEKFSKSIHR